MQRKTIVIGIIVLVVLGIGAYVYVRTHQPAPQVEARTAAVVDVTRGNLSNTLIVAGQFQPYQNVELHAKVSGYIRTIGVDIGDRVHSGEVLATLEVPELEEQLEGTKAHVSHSKSEVERAQSELARDESAHTAVHDEWTRLAEASKEKPGLIAEQELDDAQAKDREAEAQIDVAKSSLAAARQELGVTTADNHRVQDLSDYTRITAPFTGVVTWRYADTGSLIQAGTSSDTQSMPVVRVAESDLLRLRMPVPESDVPYIHEGGVVDIDVSAVGRKFTGKVIRFTRDLDSNTRTMITEVDVPNKDLSLSPGMYAETTIQLQHNPDALSLPSQAIVHDGDLAYVLVVDAQNRIRKQQVETGIETANRTEIRSGLTEGERVVASGQSGYHQGDLVTPHEAFIPTKQQEAGS